ncbi:glycosyltransferase family 32 protein [Laetiporus sulphureus 93-53]|uniref:Glycosyltransferase family 32 protein n=1 Tax=Laetiporus sulphureus 93-53 TaxID=1314785 RepID=A0A165I2U8_9APHY|nr:glycosyltransferase family 32 protein [Laetiporus sulphureus 93-53]KZT12518.1 glycosyltransferase family 32 protein [Laetiporus sulphureus 93-53]
MFRRRTVYIFLSLLAAVLVGTVIVLSSISYYLSIDVNAYITELELDVPFNATDPWNATEHGKVERIPRILHQTWKTETLPEKWADVSQGCRDMMPDYEYMLWTDASSREFIAENYPWFLETFDGYKYPIQRADAIRYFILYHYGGIYLDLDIGCLRPLDPLLTYPVILAKTIPVGVSNDLIFSEAGHPFMEQMIHGIKKFDHNWVLNYPTVMFSTGPMFVSAQYGLYTSTHPPTLAQPGGEVRVLPKSLYGKNAKPGEAPHSFFSHYYGSSWHADDAAFIGFLGKWGKGLMWIGLVVFILGVIRLALAPHARRRKYRLRRIGGYEVMMPRWVQRDGRWYLDLGWFGLPSSGASSPIQPASPVLSEESSDDTEEEDMQLLPLSFAPRSSSPTPSDASFTADVVSSSSWQPPSGRSTLDVVRRASRRVMTTIFGASEVPERTPRRRRSRGVLFFLPAIFTPSHAIELQRGRSLARSPTRLSASLSRASANVPPEKLQQPCPEDLEAGTFLPIPELLPRGRAANSSFSSVSSSSTLS